VLARLSRLVFQARRPMSGSVTGHHRSPHRGASVEFAEYRKYVPGDDIRHVDWRVYGRTDRFYLKEFEADTNLRCHLVVDTSGSMGFAAEHGERLTYAARLAATLAALLVRQGDAVGLQPAGEGAGAALPPRHHPVHLRRLFDSISGLRAHGPTRLTETLHTLAEQAPRRAVVAVFSDLFTETGALLEALRHLAFQRHDVAVFHLLDPVEIDFPFDRPMRFADMESPFALLTDPAAIRAAYREAVDQSLDAIARGCREHGAEYRLVRQDRAYADTLADFLIQRSRGGGGLR
jgi:uncharacterized protein (DUF58 family)